ncbi:DUF4325 domain-containing protein [Candidatus Berkelbacteria bacterium CG_4_8_14_3_um_filter_33_6]|uniref:DUF4325 domain-containing protein n=1 Tax=Candidatus Berkelbacteria bacterium CG_4_10_14_0_2_um_filter_35_9_33_12 TaxID=1974499 RepID=A0A2M7W3G5_9BACT|nr:MAG: DUF4325 domain-containing protein [Candidatus Berkelbacteria bacterium CG23_combo_of_CG06-09_8_20_14_all_33_15]PIX31222.1 MAG: DUF4325 domain-containing protein [Candidatus Berkelbacteria bacterium CG_4_8_14_3_um_filter_33_6]PIZ27937.1 MAG: DUF4325 domain-containing protein [Candidatus Berkelbacteria bacterium CG_4_10_14_0_8_um_filter_35_9_33_8]PJA20016.1 MAG: DUF4325 domain-containing protein [Candidatus Berkelbacteria bacterium CG_4_10_14_0_2_um_filter_35_9_33_12]
MTEIKLKQFGEMLLSRPAGREAWLAAQAYSLPKDDEKIIVDFDGVLVLSPSWADEFITKLKEKYSQVELINTSNASVKASLEII